MKRLAIALIALAVPAVAIAIAITNSGDDDSDSSRARREQNDIVQNVSARDRAKVLRIVARSGELRQILGSHAYHIRSIGHWTGTAELKRLPPTAYFRQLPKLNRELRRYGTRVQLELDHQIDDLEADWIALVLRRGPKSYPPYRRYNTLLKVGGLRGLDLYVDLRRSFLASILPGASSGFEVLGPRLNDAAKVAEDWVRAHRRSGESWNGHECGATGAGEDMYKCSFRLHPTGRRLRIFMREMNVRGHLKVRIQRVRTMSSN